MIILHTSDLHGRYSLLEDRRFDVWVDTGDFFPDTAAAYRAAGPWEFAEMQRDYQSRWWDEVGHVVVDALAGRPVVLVGGNHDFADLAERLGTRYVAPGEPVVVDGVRFAGHRLVPPLNGMYAGESGDAERRDAARAALADRPDVLITHVPPAGILSGPWGCRPLATAVLSAAYGSHAPALHLFGHVHHAAGVETVGPTTFVNSAQTARYLAVSI